VQYGGLCWPSCVGKDAIRQELERRVAAENRWKVVGKYVSGNVAVIKTELKIGYIEFRRRPGHRLEYLRDEGRQDRGCHPRG
jgi:hypothetical protein